MSEPVVVDVLDSHGRVALRQRIELEPDARGFTVGRGVGAEVMLDDPYVAPVHVRIELTPEGQLHATDLGTLNGIIVGGERLHGAQGLVVPDGLLQVGRTRLHIHTLQQPVGPEKPDHASAHAAPRTAVRIALAGAAACIAFVSYFAWLGATRDTATLIVGSLISSMVAAGAWIAMWSLLSRVIKGESRWVVHAAVLFGVVAGLLAIDILLDLLQFAFAVPQLPLRDILQLIAAIALALYLHLTQVWTMPRRTAVLFAGLLPLVVIGTGSWIQDRSQMRDVNYIGVQEQVFPPALRLRAGGTVDRYFDDAARLQEQADKKRRAMPADDTGDADED